MRRIVLFAAPLIASTLAFACDDDSTKPAGDGGADATTEKDSGPVAPNDAGPVDATTGGDAGGDGGMEPPVTAIVLDAKNAPTPGVDVYFTPNGSTTTVVVKTGADGRASHVMPAGGTVTARLDIPGTSEMTTVVGVADGDLIHFTRLTKPGSAQLGHVAGTVAAVPDAGVTTYTLDLGSCPALSNAPPPAYNETIFADCLDAQGKLTMLFTATDQGTGLPIAYAVKQPVLAPDAGSTTVDVLAADWQATTPKNVTYSGALPAWVTQTIQSTDFPLSGGRQFALRYVNSAPANATQPLAIFPPPATSLPQVELQTSLNGNDVNESFIGFHVRRVASATALSEDYTAFLPRIHGLVATGIPAAPSFTWQTDAPPGVDLVGVAQLFGFTTQDGGQTPLIWDIAFAVPKGTTSVTVPAMPPAAVQDINGASFNVQSLTVGASPQAPWSVARTYPAFFSTGYGFASQYPTPAGGSDIELHAATLSPSPK